LAKGGRYLDVFMHAKISCTTSTGKFLPVAGIALCGNFAISTENLYFTSHQVSVSVLMTWAEVVNRQSKPAATQ